MTNLWNNPNVPHKGWLIAGNAEDGGSPIYRCQMCNKPDIRYLHPVTHPDYGDLIVGSECADKMTADARAKYERHNLEKTKNRLKHFVDNGWDKLAANVWTRTYQHHWNIQVIKLNDYYRYVVHGNIRPWHFKTLDAAKIAVFEYIKKQTEPHR